MKKRRPKKCNVREQCAAENIKDALSQNLHEVQLVHKRIETKTMESQIVQSQIL